MRISRSCACAPGLPGPHWVFLLTSLMVCVCVPSVFHCVSRCTYSISWVRVKGGKSTHRPGTQAGLSVLPTLAWLQPTLQVTTEVIYKNYIIVLFGDSKFEQVL